MSQTSHTFFSQSKWQTAIILTLALWLGGSLLLDFIIMPGMFAAGMMSQPGFASAGYSIFEVFNHVELLCAAVVLTGALALQLGGDRPAVMPGWAIALSLILFAIPIIYTYSLTPEMSALGLNLNQFDSSVTVPSEMELLHGSYWGLELCKFALAASVLKLYLTRERSLV